MDSDAPNGPPPSSVSVNAAARGPAPWGPLRAVSEILLNRRAPADLFATGLALFIVAALMYLLMMIITLFVNPLEINRFMLIIGLVWSTCAVITGVAGLMVMLAGAIRAGTRSD